MKQATMGDTVRVHYRGTLADGTEFDTSEGRDPLQVTIGSGDIIPSLETALVGMNEGDTKSVTLDPADAYGQKHPELVHVVERTRIPEEIDLKVGTVLQASDRSGGQVRLHVVDFDDDNVTLDANHPLAGRSLTFELQLVEVVA